jgi:K+-sensing histidine kinase KdpD
VNTRSLLALVPPLAAICVQWLFWGLLHPYAWFLFYPAVFLSSWLGGLRAGLISTSLSVSAAWWLFIPPIHSLTKEPPELVPAAIFIAVGVATSVIHDQMR